MTHVHGKSVILGLGSNLPGRWGTRRKTLERAVGALEGFGVETVAASRLYESAALGSGRQPPFLNSVLVIRTDMTPAELVRAIKSIERAAGRKQRRRWAARTLDIDILDYKGRILNWKNGGRTASGSGLILPHPEMDSRVFVLKPLIEVAPNWRHPVFDRKASQLLALLDPGVQNSAQPA